MSDKAMDRSHFRALVRSKVKRFLGIAVPEDELLRRSISHGDLRLSSFIQEYLNSKVGVVSLTVDRFVPTMVGALCPEYRPSCRLRHGVLAKLGYELRSVTLLGTRTLLRTDKGRRHSVAPGRP